MIHSIT